MGTQTSPNPGAQRRPGRQPRRHHARRPRTARPSPPLNEGRDVSPGDTMHGGRVPHARPPRSTKAGTSAPATPPGRACSRHRHSALNEGRDVSPGDTPALGRRHADGMALNEGRDVSPGDTRNNRTRAGSPCPLNEGRDVSPGDTLPSGHDRALMRLRSTKAGTSAPATLLIWHDSD